MIMKLTADTGANILNMNILNVYTLFVIISILYTPEVTNEDVSHGTIPGESRCHDQSDDDDDDNVEPVNDDLEKGDWLKHTQIYM